jgi:hypothetical protein
MPWIMEQPYDLEFSRSGADVVLKLEEFDQPKPDGHGELVSIIAKDLVAVCLKDRPLAEAADVARHGHHRSFAVSAAIV